LQEIDKKYGLIRKGDRLLDLGCYPGSWSQYGIKTVGPKGNVVGIDVTRPDRLTSPVFSFIQADVLDLDLEWLFREVGPRDAVISDLAPRTTGIPSTDVSRSMALGRQAYRIALALLRKKGGLVCKVFEGEDLGELRSEASARFGQLRLLRPKATRKGSREIYLVGVNFVK
ncbi:MAG: RlmE family RNA methyltransferase, partial [Deltaproteobacteria bacterium]|nr:RlmE family RNA methyltransferase [Deltaproteobacteria bacterium]